MTDTLERLTAVDERDANVLYLHHVPRTLGVHDDPRFPELIRQIGLGHVLASIPTAES